MHPVKDEYRSRLLAIEEESRISKNSSSGGEIAVEVIRIREHLGKRGLSDPSYT